MSVSNNIREFRTSRHLRQGELAEAVGSCSRTISRIERDICNPSLELALRIASVLEVPVETLFHVE